MTRSGEVSSLSTYKKQVFVLTFRFARDVHIILFWYFFQVHENYVHYVYVCVLNLVSSKLPTHKPHSAMNSMALLFKSNSINRIKTHYCVTGNRNLGRIGRVANLSNHQVLMSSRGSR